MTSTALQKQTYLPEQVEQLARVFDFLSAHGERYGNRPVPCYMLVGPEAHDQVEVPAELHRVLLQVVEALRAGRAVTVAPQSLTLTTQQAADLLGVSRPTVVKLIEDGEIPCDRTSHRRKVLLQDVLDYRERRRAAQYDALMATSPVDIDEDEDPQKVLAELRQTRKEVAAARRQNTPPAR
jgi:excisionase family DNA binding protein